MLTISILLVALSALSFYYSLGGKVYTRNSKVFGKIPSKNL